MITQDKIERYLLSLTLIIFLSGCDIPDLKELINIDRTAPLLEIDTQTKNIETRSNSISISFNSSEEGTLLYEKDCQSNIKKVHTGKNTIIFDNLEDGFYDFCTITAIDLAGNQSKTVEIPTFSIKRSEQPSLQEVIPITSNTFDNTPSYTFRSSSEGTISYQGSCKSLQQKAKIGNNVVTFQKLEDGYYPDCAILVTDLKGLVSQELKINPFSISSNKDFQILNSVTPKRLSTLDLNVQESSGLLYIDGKLYTHNDSGGKAEVYEIDSYGRIVRTITINGATNVDWEAMTQDDLYLYIADIGNNKGDRKDLKIYKVDKPTFMSHNNVDCEIIEIKYSDQENFEYKDFSTPYDAEAIIAYGDNLYIFTKNWKDKVTKVYSISKNSGSYTLHEVSSYACNFLITDATYHIYADKIILIGYSSHLMSTQKIVILENFSADDFFSGTIQEIEVNANTMGFKQIEAITNDIAEKIYITSEELSNKFIGNHPSSLFEVRIFE